MNKWPLISALSAFMLMTACGSDSDGSSSSDSITVGEFTLPISQQLESSDNVEGIWLYASQSDFEYDNTFFKYPYADEIIGHVYNGSTNVNMKSLFRIKKSGDSLVLTLCNGEEATLDYTGGDIASLNIDESDSESNYEEKTTYRFANNISLEADSSILEEEIAGELKNTEKQTTYLKAIKISDNDSFDIIEKASLMVKELTAYEGTSLIEENKQFNLTCYLVVNWKSSGSGSPNENTTYKEVSEGEYLYVDAEALDMSKILLTSDFSTTQYDSITKVEGQEDYKDSYTYNGDFEIEIDYSAPNNYAYLLNFFNYNDTYLNEEDDLSVEWDGGLTVTKTSAKLQGKSISNGNESADISLMIEF